MSKNKRQPHIGGARQQAGAPKSVSATAARKGASNLPAKAKRRLHLPLLPIPLITFVLLWAWIALWHGDEFRMIRENSFFAFDSTLMDFELGKQNGLLWTIGRGLLTTFRTPWIGGLLLSFLLTASCWMLGYVLRLKGWLRSLQYLPLAIFTGIFTYQGINNWFEAESGHVMGFPLIIFAVLALASLVVRFAFHKPAPAIVCLPKDETPRHNRLQLYAVLLVLAAPMYFGQKERPYVRPLAQMQVGVMEQDWQRVIDVAHDNDELSNRPMTAYYAMALVQSGQIGDRLFDIRIDYDSIYAFGLNQTFNNTNMYLMESDFHAGLVETSYHHAMESMAIEGPTLRNLKVMCKAAILRSEWEMADKYLTILDKVPFEGDFVRRYRPMLRDRKKVDADPEFALIRKLEPMHDTFENYLVLPVFLGYNAALTEGRSQAALLNALMVSIYTKSIPGIMARLEPLVGTTPPSSVMEVIALLSGKENGLKNAFPSTEMYMSRLANFIDETRQYVTTPEERAKHARELFPRYKGYYPFYYFFGNLKSTRKVPKDANSSAGVN